VRDIKFIAYNIVTKKMIDLAATTPMALNPHIKIGGLFLPFDTHIILLQYIGIKDTEGTEVYEGMIVDGMKATRKSYRRGVVEYHKTGFIIRCGLERLRGLNGLKVLGNIYQHPELLNKGKKS